MNGQVGFHAGDGVRGEDTISVRLGNTDHHRPAAEWLQIAHEIRKAGIPGPSGCVLKRFIIGTKPGKIPWLKLPMHNNHEGLISTVRELQANEPEDAQFIVCELTYTDELWISDGREVLAMEAALSDMPPNSATDERNPAMGDDFDRMAAKFCREATIRPPNQDAIAELIRRAVNQERARIADRVSDMDNGCGAASIAERIKTI